MTVAAVTVLVCTYNDESTIADSLQSVLAQTAPPSRYKIIVVDDGSTDATRWILDSYRDHIDIVQLPNNQGLVAACNAGLARIKTRSFVRFDTDDRFDPELIASLLACRDSTGADLVYTDRYEELPSGRRTVRRLASPPQINDLIAAGALLPTALVQELGGYRDLFWEEIDLYMRLLSTNRCRLGHIARPLYVYRVQKPDQMTADEAALEAGWQQLREMWPGASFLRTSDQAPSAT